MCINGIIESKCHFISVVPWRDILKYLQKCEGCTHFCDTLYIFMPTDQLEAMLNAAGIVDHNESTFLQGDHLNALIDCCFHCSNGARILQIDIVFQRSPEDEIWEVQFRHVRCLFHFRLAADKTVPKLFMEQCHRNISSLRRSTTLLEPPFLFFKILTPVELSLQFLKQWNVALLLL